MKKQFWVEIESESHNPTGVVCWDYYPDDKPVKGNWISVVETKELHDTQVMLQRLINKVNMVTAYWRHQGLESITDGAISELYERQLLAEEFLKKATQK